MGEDNISLQEDEVQALLSIYGSDSIDFNDDSRSFRILVSAPKLEQAADDPDLSAELHIRLSDAYPLESPPEFSISSPQLNADKKRQLNILLQHAYLEKIGQPVLFDWVELTREFLINPNSGANSPTQSSEGDLAGNSQCGDAGDCTDSAVDLTKPQDSDADVMEGNENTENPLNIVSGDTVTDRKSTFQAHVAHVLTRADAEAVLDTLKQNRKVAAATHNIYAYRICAGQIKLQDCADDGEHGAGAKLLHLLDTSGAENVMVVVTRWYGGIHLGPDRFRHILNVARIILQRQGYIKEKAVRTKKGKKK